MSNYVMYQGRLLAKNSESYKLYTEKRFAELDKHSKQLHSEAIKRGEVRQHA